MRTDEANLCRHIRSGKALQHHFEIRSLRLNPSHSNQRLTSFSRAYIEPTSDTDSGDQKRSAIAASRGQRRESRFSAVASSSHIAASPPRESFSFAPAPDPPLPRGADRPHSAARPAASGRDNSRPRESRDTHRGPAASERFLPSPGLNQDALREIRLQDFVPPNHAFTVACATIFSTRFVEHRLQSGGIGNVVRLHELADVRLACPCLGGDLVPADVKVVVGKTV